MPREEHKITSHPEKWRYGCPTPREHTNWFPINGHFRCHGCAELRAAGEDSIEPEFDELRDKKTGELIPRSEISLAVDDKPRARA